VDELERLGEPASPLRLQQREDGGKVAVVLRPRRLRLEEEDDLGSGVRDPSS
jgi:hypothetical protein